MKVPTEPRLPELPKYSDESLTGQQFTTTSREVIRKEGSRVYGSAADLRAVSSNGGNIRKTAEDSIRQIQASRARDSRPIQISALGNFKTPPKVRIENRGKTPTPLETLREKTTQPTKERVYTFPDKARLHKCLLKHPILDDQYYRDKGITQEVSDLAATRFAKRERVEGGITLGALLVVEDLNRGVDGLTEKKLPQVIPNINPVKNVISRGLEIALKDCSNKKGILERAVDWIEEHTPPGGHYEVVP